MQANYSATFLLVAPLGCCSVCVLRQGEKIFSSAAALLSLFLYLQETATVRGSGEEKNLSPWKDSQDNATARCCGHEGGSWERNHQSSVYLH